MNWTEFSPSGQVLRIKKNPDCLGRMYLFGNVCVLLLFLPIYLLICWYELGSEDSLPHMANLLLAV